MKEPSEVNPKEQRTRRNIMKMGAILGAVALAKTERARAASGVGPQVFRGPGPSCLLRGTNVRTTAGDRKVEDLATGDLLPTVFGGVRPIQWIGRFPIKKSDPSRPWPKEASPVRICRSAIAPDVPHADLLVSNWHALLIDGLLIPAGNLINGTTIARDEAHADGVLEFFHIKLESHDAIYAEGAPVETMLRVDETAVNFAEYFRTYGMPETEGARCAPLASFGGMRGDYRGMRGELNSRFRSAISPWFDRRKKIDVIRDRLEERAVALTLELAPSI